MSKPAHKTITISHAERVTGLRYETLFKFAQRCQTWVSVNDNLRAYEPMELANAIESGVDLAIRKDRRNLAVACLRRWAQRGQR